MTELGNKIKKLRTEKKMSMRELAEKLDVSHAHISKLESGKNLPSITMLQSMAELFDVHMRDFFDIEDVGEIEPGVRIGFDKNEKDELSEEDTEKALELLRDIRDGKYDILTLAEKIKDIKL